MNREILKAHALVAQHKLSLDDFEAWRQEYEDESEEEEEG